jgi:DNA-directed RNA polymerase specialized sigma24 family protein
VSGDNKSAAITKQKLQTRVKEAYEAYERKDPGSADGLMQAVRKIAYTKVYHLEHDFKEFGSAETADDWTQDICASVWSGLDKFVGTPSLFYSWVCKIAIHKSSKAFNTLKKDSETKVQLFIDKNDEDGEDENNAEQDNPEIYEGSGGYGGGVSIPASVQRIERNICELMMDGRSFEQVAEELNMTVEAVKQRLKRLRKRMNEEREQEKKKEVPPGILVPMRVTKPQARAKDFAGKAV